ncbi:Uncharacterized protein PECH_006650 [Penicillium ucsense]|uniref:Uncharacterized protein n=1 Tax=Penicillium ucsense TaxID=2839758 RepID=A0A8J8W8W6_9EURO|nr:Uncharacterized protein PECM_000296 [Penicillium ucsense]KAF7735447.1 Uncharacterized protein PECH_006650 [Penicillium ucsense]
MSLNFSCPDSLTRLSGLAEEMIKESAQMIRKSDAMPMSTRLQRSIPTYYDGFQDALDNLSEQIFIAKAFLEKEYGAIKAREAVPPPNESVSTTDIGSKTEGISKTPSPAPDKPREEAVKVEPTTDESTIAVPTAPVVASSHDKTDEHKTDAEEKEPGTESATNQTMPGSGEGMKYDTGLDGAGAHNSFDLNCDFGNDDSGNQAFLSGTSFGNPTASNDKGGQATASAKPQAAPTAGGDAFDMELGKTDSHLNSFADHTNGMDDMMGPGESSFDDLFMEADNMGGTGGDLQQLEGNNLMEMNELDDSWFS